MFKCLSSNAYSIHTSEFKIKFYSIWIILPFERSFLINVNKIISTNLEIRTLIFMCLKKIILNRYCFSNKSMQFIMDPTVYRVVILRVHIVCFFI